jgi:diguanylate cyclase (GGDEF)-like protein/PAS domain S-box-containing protein
VGPDAELRQFEHALADTQALAHVGSWEWELSQPCAGWSDELCRIFGLAPGFAPTWEEFRALVHPEDRAIMDAQVASVEDGRRASSSYRIVRPGGELRHVSARSHGRTDKWGDVTHLFGTIQDVTEARLAGIARREAQELFETAFTNAPIGMALVGLDGRWIRVNDAICRMLGWSAEELATMTFQDITHPEDLDADMAQVGMLVAGEISGYEMEKRYVTRSQRQIWVRLSVSLIRDEDGEPRHFVSQLEDITQRREDERKLRAAEADARAQRDHATAIIGAMHEGYALTHGGEIKAVNDALCTLTGYEQHELIGQRPPYPFWPPELRKENMALRRTVLDQRGGTFEVTLMRRTGERFEAEVTAQPAFDQAGQVLGFVNTVRDVSVQRRQRRELELRAQTDHLTGLANRHVLHESLTRGAALAARRRGPMALILLDLDWFKQVNDRFGHPTGDLVLVEVARRLEATVRIGEVLARVGGEEFAWLLPEADAERAVVAAGRARAAIASEPFTKAGHMTISAGVGVLSGSPSAPADGDALYRLADQALYEAKQQGRNRTCCQTLDDAVSQANALT